MKDYIWQNNKVGVGGIQKFPNCFQTIKWKELAIEMGYLESIALCGLYFMYVKREVNRRIPAEVLRGVIILSFAAHGKWFLWLCSPFTRRPNFQLLISFAGDKSIQTNAD